MKTLRYLLIAVAILSMVSVRAQENTTEWGRLPEAQMHSTSVMQGSGSTLPSAAKNGIVTTYDSNSSTETSHKPRRAKMGDDDWEDDEWGDTEDPWATPLGNEAWPLALLAFAYVGVCVLRKRRA